MLASHQYPALTVEQTVFQPELGIASYIYLGQLDYFVGDYGRVNISKHGQFLPAIGATVKAYPVTQLSRLTTLPTRKVQAI